MPDTLTGWIKGNISAGVRFNDSGLESCSRIAGGNTFTADTFQAPGLRCHIFSMPSLDAEVGGDIFYVTTCNFEIKSKFLLVDTVGHGEDAAKLSSELLPILGSVASKPCNKDMLAELNNLLCRSTSASIFATAIASTFNLEEGNWTYAYAGHPNMLLRRDNVWRELKPGGDNTFPAGVICDTQYYQTHTSLKYGDWILMYSDGVLDAVGQQARAYTAEPLIRLAASIQTNDSEGFFLELVNRLADTREGAGFDDDATFILIENLTPSLIRSCNEVC